VICRDPLDVERVRDWLSASSVVEVVADCLSLAESIPVIQRHAPQLLLVDLRLLRPATVRRLAYSSARDRIIFLKSESEDRLEDGVDRVASTSLSSRALFVRAIEACAHVQRSLTANTSIPRLIDLLTGKAVRSSRSTFFAPGGILAIVDEDNVDWIEAEGECTKLHGHETRIVDVPFASLMKEFRRRRARFVQTSNTDAVNLRRVQELRVEASGSRTVVLSSGMEKAVEPQYVRGLLKALEKRSIPAPRHAGVPKLRPEFVC
jgi:DNA-binding LytR/AlgR family response regulator